MIHHVLGIDIGGTGIKGAIVDTKTGKLIGEKHKIKTPEDSTPEAVLEVVKKMIEHFGWEDKPIGFGFPAIVKDGVSLTAANVHSDWVNFPVQQFFANSLKIKTSVINDADAAGLAEMSFGNITDKHGTIVFITLGTGIGSALFYDGKLIPNSEFGWVPYKKSIVEHYASNKARETKHLSWAKWGKELDAVLHIINRLIAPQMIILGGGVSKEFDKFSPYLTQSIPVYPAMLKNDAGIIGAAMACTFK